MINMKTTVDCSQSQPKSWYETCNTIKIVPDAPYGGRYSNINGLVYCDCPCHQGEGIMHFDSCCNLDLHRVKIK